ncbi:hypothetical protein [Ottowia sp.]|uniref:hypothetical protein n=1 Tax=Ottowia sp. TaxID=1898956 RepID=UPI003A8453A8
MNTSLWWWLIPVVLFFWAVGAYNRLVRLRAAVGKAFAVFDEQLVRQVVWIQGCLPEAMRGGLQTSPIELDDPVTAAWARLHATSDQVVVALAKLRGHPMDGAGMAALVLAHEAMRTAWAGALAEAIAEDAVPSAQRLQERWMRLLHQSLPLRAAFNEAVQSYNQGIGQFPAWLLARVFGFKPAGALARLAEPR